ncbi:hypothetical protein [Streptomyces tsukubensis]|uniref:hypothetical protein n=1 Tax=Streptomyces tsukubensis TaxID=83656 RepID=UPI003450F069
MPQDPINPELRKRLAARRARSARPSPEDLARARARLPRRSAGDGLWQVWGIVFVIFMIIGYLVR